ncbi:MAG TPA: hypothetical protein VKT25_10890, partial [Ktedonobacteraceae bacterium]|nr:hypothetical protein [Ktedonobacteraceae bacterium]
KCICFPVLMKRSSLRAGASASRRVVRGRRPTAGEGRFGAGSLMSGFTFTWVKKQGGTAHHAA